MKKYLFILLYSITILSCSDEDKNNELKASANIAAKSNSNVTGIVEFEEVNGEVSLKANIKGLTPGSHAIHIHAKGDCSSDDGKSAGGHWNPTNADHGEWGHDHFHIGDIGNIETDEKGNGSISMKTDLWCINCGDETKDIIGKAIIIHASADDFESQPSGAAGARVGCGEIVAQ